MTSLWQRRIAAGVVALCLSYVVASLLFDKRQGEGRVILALTESHGVHSGDIPVLFAWIIGMAGCAWVALRS
jgi:hypothetical protein